MTRQPRSVGHIPQVRSTLAVALTWLFGASLVAACSEANDGTLGTGTGVGGSPSGGAGGSTVTTSSGGTGASTTTTSTGSGASGGQGGGSPTCPSGMICPVSFPFHHEADTSQSTVRDLDGYACSPSTDEGGPEIVYQVVLPNAGFLSAAVVDDPDAGIDVDVHLLSDLDAAACLDRGNHHARAHVSAGTYYVVVDTYVSGAGEQSGPYAIDIGFIDPPEGSCAMTTDVVERIGGPSVTLPETGPMVLEAHLVTVDDGFGASWPSAIQDGIPNHYSVSFAATDFVMARGQPWAPQEGCEFGQSAYGSKLPVLDEGWYVNMMWSTRPPAGTRMILRRPAGGPAVVAAAGYETGPGDTDYLGGTTEEVHFYLGTGHLDEMRIGFAVDQSLPLGPIECSP